MSQLLATSKFEALSDHRELLQTRWNQLESFVFAEKSPTKLSPESKKLKTSFFQQKTGLTGGASGSDKTDTKFAPGTLKNYKKRLSGYMQSVTNASDRLNEVHREECVLCDFQKVFYISISIFILFINL